MKPSPMDRALEVLTLPLWALWVFIMDVIPAWGVRVSRLRSPRGRVMRLYEPKGITHTAAVCFLHGGGWRMGWPAIFAFYGKALARRGYRVLLPSYVRLTGGLDAMEADVIAALNAAGDRFFPQGGAVWIMSGVSAGAQLAASVALKGDVFDGRAAGVVAISAPLRALRGGHPVMDALVYNLFDRRAAHGGFEPYALMHEANRVPTLIVHGGHDPWVVPACSDVGEGACVTRMVTRYRHTGNIGRALMPRLRLGGAVMGFIDGLAAKEIAETEGRRVPSATNFLKKV